MLFQMASMKVLLWGKIEGKNIIIADDVLTTGYTLHVAIKHLRDSRALAVQVIVCAVTKMPGKG